MWQILTASATDLQNTGDDIISGSLVESRAKALLEDRGPGRSTAETKATTATGNLKFWTTDGTVTKYELTVRGKITANGQKTDADRTTVLEIKDIGTTTVVLPEKARKKLRIE